MIDEDQLRRLVELGAAYRVIAARVDVSGAEWSAARMAFFGEVVALAERLGMHEEAKSLVMKEES